MYILFYYLGERSVSALPFHLFTWNSCTLRTWNLTSRSTMVHHKSSQCPDNSIIIFAYICDISLQHSTTFYNALPFGTWRKNIYTNQLPPNIENSFSCLGGFFLVGFCTPHLFWGSGSGHICHLSTRPCKQRIKSPLAPEADRPFPGAHGCPPSRGVRMGPVWDRWMIYGSMPWYQPELVDLWSDCWYQFWLIWWATWWASLHIITISNGAEKSVVAVYQ